MKISFLSVVIATLGGPSLTDTIAQMNRGKLVPSEILVCIPKSEASKVARLSFPNVKVVKTDCRGQVAQRSIGFQQAQYPMVLQLDDDILVPEKTINTLADALLSLGHRNVVAPLFFNAATNRCCHEVPTGIYGWLKSFYYYFFCCAPWGIKRMGKITKIGIGFGVDDKHCTAAQFETEWLPGGCVLSFKEDLISDNFFPFKGKAYSEDLMHSYWRTQKGLRHWVIPTAWCFVHSLERENRTASIAAQNQARRHFVKLTGEASSRLAVYEIILRAMGILRTGIHWVWQRLK